MLFIGIAHHYLNVALSVIVPLILYKIVFPSLYSKKSTNKNLRCSLFCGFICSSIVVLLIIIIYNCTIYRKFSNALFWLFVLPIPVPFLLFLLVDFVGIICCVSTFKQSVSKRFHVAFIIIMLFVRMISYHIGWIFLLLITIPLQVGTVILIFVTYYIALAFSFATAVHNRKVCCNRTLSAKILFIGTYTFVTLSFFLTIYYSSLAIYPHEDGITKLISSLLPFIFIGFCSWIARNIILKVIDYDEENKDSHGNENTQNSNNENTPLFARYQSTAATRTKLSINSNA